MMSLNPVTASSAIFERYCSYITTTFRLKRADLNRQIENILREPGKFAKGPIVEILPPFVPGQSPEQLIQRGLLQPEFLGLNQKHLPADRDLYLHQEQAIEIISNSGQSAVVATGTGSGKTECFMIPILNHLFREKARGTLGPGVRALLLYPMNALANDQMKRLRHLLAGQDEITFGIYTGETKEEEENALAKYERMFGGLPLPNEIVSRKQMRKSPPHILLTNYAMLEYLLLRPADNVFFHGPFAANWAFIVLDEAHTYTGAKGIEMAMLLARLKDAVGAKKGDLRFVLTSATLGGGRKDAKAVAKFASRLTGEDVQAGQVITASHPEDIIQSAAWGKPNPWLYAELQGWLDNPAQTEYLKDTLHKAGVPPSRARRFLDAAPHDPAQALYFLLRGDGRLSEVLSLMEEGPVDLNFLAQAIFAGATDAVQLAASFLDLCNQARLRSEDKALLPARFHFFVKALEGAFIAFTPRTKISLERVKWVREGGEDYKAFELGACTRCHGLYLLGEVEQRDGHDYLEPMADHYNPASLRNLEFFAVVEQQDTPPENEDDVLEGLGLRVPLFTHYRLCVRCGGIGDHNSAGVCACDHPRTILLRKVNRKGRAVHKCGLCGSVNPKASVVRRFYLTEDAISSVLSTALYQQLPGRVLKQRRKPKDGTISSVFGDLAETALTREKEKIKQLLVFSDSRQNAAYFAPYLSLTYGDLLAGNLMLRTVAQYREECLANRWNLVDFNRRVRRLINELGVLDGSVETLEELVWKWIMREFTLQTGRFSLQNMGLLVFQPNFEQVENCELLWRFRGLQKVGITPEEAKILYSFLLEQFRRNRAVEYPELVGPRDDFFAPQNQQGGFWSKRPPGIKAQPAGYSLKGWLPAGSSSNTRLDYLQKVLPAGGRTTSKVEAEGLLNDLWRTLLDQHSPLREYIREETLAGQGKIYKLHPSLFKVVPGDFGPAFYRCDTCYRITQFNLRGVCPAYRCSGRLQSVDLNEELKDNHYRRLHLEMKPEAMVAHEHTAQLTTEYAAQVQTDFIEGRINVLSCSTTFELGVDVGDLETVFMKNVPPSPANYAQRAGRAGRSIDATAFALTFARLASHDFNHFSSPKKMISGVVKPPYFDTNNEKIARRHLYACAFADFWRVHPGFFRRVEDFFCCDGPNQFRKYLSHEPQGLLQTLKAVFSPQLQAALGIQTWAWVDEMYAERGVMTKTVQEIMGDLLAIDEAIEQAVEDKKYRLAARLQRVSRTMENRPLINYLAQKSLLPKYGFPVDVVNLDVNLHTTEARNVDLSRDMQIAIAEYAPDSQVVANGKLWTGRFVKRVSGKGLLRYHYLHCPCGYFGSVLDVKFEQSSQLECPACQQRQAQGHVFIVPEFGFIAEERSKEPGTARPERTYGCRKFFSGAGNLIDSKDIRLGKGTVSVSTYTHGQLTVINNGLGAGFYLCRVCGYGTCQHQPPQKHEDAYGRECTGTFEKLSLGYNLETDIARIDCFPALNRSKSIPGYWESLLYALIEGMSAELEIERNDLDGTVYVDRFGQSSIILFDTVPGGAGHVKRILEKGVLKAVVRCSLEQLKRCGCGGERKDTSCYGCLRNYRNQFVHDRLRRDYAIEALNRLLNG